jgi:hypothetical protein
MAKGGGLGEIIELNIVLQGVSDTFVLNLESLGFRLQGGMDVWERQVSNAPRGIERLIQHGTTRVSGDVVT